MKYFNSIRQWKLYKCGLFLTHKTTWAVFICLHLLIIWDDKMPVWWVEVRWMTEVLDIALGYDWTSDNSQKMDPLLQVIPDHPGMRMSMVKCQRQIMSVVRDSKQDREEWISEISHHTIQNGTKFKFMNYFWNFPFNIFKLWLISYNWNYRMQTGAKGGL